MEGEVMEIVARQPILWGIALLSISIATRDSFADNGQLALARPLSQITIDGDFADWPSSLPRYAIEFPGQGKPPRNAGDLKGSFRVGYDQNALYVAVEVRDESIVTDGTRKWDSQDGCSVYLDIEHSARDTKPTQFNIYGDGSQLYAAAGLKVASWSCQRSGTLHRYEWRFDIKLLSRGQVKFEPGRVVGMDISLCDKDEDGSFSWVSWGTGLQKSASSTRLGDIMLLSADDDLGKLHGQLVGVTGAATPSRQTVMIDRNTQTSPVTVMSNDRGEFDVVLPAGEYRVTTTPAGRIQRFQVPARGESRVKFYTTATTGQPVDVVLRAVVTEGRTTRIGRLHSYSWANDLRWGHVAGLTQTADGSLWIAGWVGLAHFDGRSMTVFEEHDGARITCNAVAMDQSGNVWGGNPLGLFRYDGESVTRYTQLHGLVSGAVRQLIPGADGSLWIRTIDGISRYDQGTFTTIIHHLGERAIATMAVESSTRLWLGMTSGGLVRLDAEFDEDGSESWRETRFGTEQRLAADQIRTLMIDSQGHLWIGADGRLTRYDGATFKTWTRHEGLPHETVLALAETADGRLWIGTDIGLVEFNDGHFTHVADADLIHDLFVDREQNIWIAGESLFRYDGNRPTYLYSRSGPQIRKPTKLLLTREGDLWVGIQRGGLARYKDEIAKSYSTDDGFLGGVVSSLLEDSQGGVWIGTNRGVSHFDGKTFASLTVDDGLSANRVNALAEDCIGRIWMGTAEGITIYDPHRSREKAADREGVTRAGPQRELTGHISHLTTIDGLQHNEIHALLADAKGSVWIGSTKGGVCRWRENAVQRFDQPAEVYCFLQGDTIEVYAGVSDGLFQFDGKQWNRVAVCGKARVLALAQGAKGHIWMATSVGLKLYDGFTAHTFTKADGMPGACWDVIWDDQENAVIVGGGKTMSYRPQSTPPHIVITGVKADEQYESVADVRIGSSQSSLDFAFHGISFSTRPEAIRYRYRLRGIDDKWQLTENPQASYGRLPPGEYTFEVMAIDRDLSYSDQPAFMSVYVHREYGQLVLWSCLCCAITAVGFLSVTVVRRNRGIRRLNVELDKRVKDRTAKLETEMAEKKQLHEQLLQAQKLDAVGTLASGIAHDFNNSLAAITGFAEVAMTSTADPHVLIEHILTAARQAAGTTKSLLTFSQESSGERVPRDVIKLVRETTGFLRKTLPISIKLIDAFQESDAIWCSIDEVHIQQVLVNLTVNARDSMPDGGEITISAGEHPIRLGFAHITITDNGTGMTQQVLKRIFDPFFTTKSRGQGTGLGMAIVHGVVEEHEGTIEIDTSVGRGTTISIALPRCSPVEAKSPLPEQFVDGGGELILVAEDNPEVRTMLEAQLESVGFQVLTAEDGQQAHGVLRQQESKERLVILDIDLPKKDGLVCLREIGLQYPHLATIVMSGLPSFDPTQIGVPFLQKPFERRELMSTINLALRNGTAQHASGVLVIDDDDAVRMSTRAVLLSNNIDVFLAQDGVEAVDQLRKNIDQIGTVLLDWHIPQTDPVTILGELRQLSRTVRVLAVSGDLALHEQDVQALGFSRLLNKPVSIDELVEAVRIVEPREDALLGQGSSDERALS